MSIWVFSMVFVVFPDKPSTARCRSEVRKLTHGSYTLAHDTDQQGSEFALDAMLFCACKGESL